MGMHHGAIVKELQRLKNEKKAQGLARFFKTGPGEYGHGDIFWGITMPQIRAVVHKNKDVRYDQIEFLIHHPVHEVRMTGLLLLVAKHETDPENARKSYIANIPYINNWDLVDVTTRFILGPIMYKDSQLFYSLLRSENIWERRLAIVATYYWIKKKDPTKTIEFARILLHDHHDLIQKAVGWMLREVGKECGKSYLCEFLDAHAKVMPRTMLRYAIEKLSEKEKKSYLQMKNIN